MPVDTFLGSVIHRHSNIYIQKKSVCLMTFEMLQLEKCFFMNMLLASFRHIFFAGNKPKGRISKRVLQERQISWKTNIFYPLIRTPTFWSTFYFSNWKCRDLTEASSLWAYFTHCSGVSIVEFEQVDAGWLALNGLT